MYLYWWKDIPNVGDAASEYLISKLSIESIQWKRPQITFWGETKKIIKNILEAKIYIPSIKGYVFPWEKCIMAIGSILDHANNKTICWGCGFREYKSKLKGGKVLAVRGKLSLNLLNIKEEIPIGDPALLLPLVYIPSKKQKTEFLKIIPHFTEYEEIKNLYSNKYTIIDIRTKDVESFIDEIVSSKYIISTSLHGVIIAHAFNIPALWIKKGYINSSDFKFYDYFSSVGITPYEGFKNIDEILSCTENIEKLFKQYSDKSKINVPIDTIQKQLLQVAPFKLKKQYIM